MSYQDASASYRCIMVNSTGCEHAQVHHLPGDCILAPVQAALLFPLNTDCIPSSCQDSLFISKYSN